MRFNRSFTSRLVTTAGVALLLLSTASAKTASKTSKSQASKSSKSKTVKTSAKKSSKSSRKSSKTRGQKAMESSRAREIQAALIREHYLDGEPSGTWDARSKTAMQKYQADHGWQSKVTPDSRALISLGLGPDHTNLINPDTAAGMRPGGGNERNQQ